RLGGLSVLIWCDSLWLLSANWWLRLSSGGWFNDSVVGWLVWLVEKEVDPLRLI
ncbi:uncharacterized protein SCHCODRAFT_02471605, partial [Schizophyllum commune H4-8]|uniref:uncharacterized protein n=1 Tax=Schizophyllum commune (strain H4-8 / FGSC 9210) TaxID=578458 RepID=UPI00215DF298